jgi:thioredoxin reductase
MKATLSVGIIGAGPGGIVLGILLARAGFRDFTFQAPAECVPEASMALDKSSR